MANHKSAIKRIRSNERKRVYNRRIITRMRTYVKKAQSAQDSGDREAAEAATREACRQLDKAVTKGVIHKNKAARKKSRLVKNLKQMSQS